MKLRNLLQLQFFYCHSVTKWRNLLLLQFFCCHSATKLRNLLQLQFFCCHSVTKWRNLLLHLYLPLHFSLSISTVTEAKGMRDQYAYTLF